MKTVLRILLAVTILCVSACSKSNTVSVSETSSDASTHKESTAAVKSIFDSLETADKISFVANDLSGKEWKSEDIFTKHKVTLVNVWGTTCGYCVIEMPELEELSKRINPDDYGVIGLITDGEYKRNDAQEIIDITGVTYPNICMDQALNEALLIQVMPTTYFVDSSGKAIGKPIYGAKRGSEYEKELAERLKILNANK